MSGDNKNISQREVEPDICKEDTDKKIGCVEEEGLLPEKFATPELTTEQLNQKGIEFGDRYEEQIKWAEFVDNAQILETDQRVKVKEYLDKLLGGLDKRYFAGSSQFPSARELEQLTAIVTRLAKMVGIRKVVFGGLVSAMKRVENRWSKLGLVSFADQLRDRLLKIPISPVSVVHHALLQCPSEDGGRHRTLRELKKILVGEVKPNIKDFPWETLCPVIQRLKFPTSVLKTDDANLSAKNSVTSNKRELCYLLVMDLRRQQLEWNEKYAAQIIPSLNWLYLLQRQEDFEELSKVYCADAMTMSPDQVKKELADEGNRDRRNKSYRKHHAKTGNKRTLKKHSKASKK